MRSAIDDRGQDRAGDIESCARSPSLGGKHAADGDDQHDDDGWVDQEHRPPTHELRQDAAEDDPSARPGCRRPLKDPQCPGPGRAFGEEVGDDGQRLGCDEGGARTLEESGKDQHQRRRREPGRERRDAEGGETDEQHPAMAGQVTDPTTKEQQGAEGQRVPRDDPLQVRRGEVQLALDGRQRDVDDAEVELENELCRDDESERQPQAKNRRMAGARVLVPGRRHRFTPPGKRWGRRRESLTKVRKVVRRVVDEGGQPRGGQAGS